MADSDFSIVLATKLLYLLSLPLPLELYKSINSSFLWSIYAALVWWMFSDTSCTDQQIHKRIVFDGTHTVSIYAVTIILTFHSTSTCSYTDLKTLTNRQGHQLLVGGWWGFLRYPNYLGDLIMSLSWSFYAGKFLCFVFILILLPYQNHQKYYPRPKYLFPQF